MPKAEKDTFKAWRDEMPGVERIMLKVTGKVECPTTGWTVSMSEAHPQGINPAILIVQINAEKPSGSEGEHPTQYPVRYEKEDQGKQYKQVTVRCEGREFTIDVGVTQ